MDMSEKIVLEQQLKTVDDEWTYLTELQLLATQNSIETIEELLEVAKNILAKKKSELHNQLSVVVGNNKWE